jgi:hypothetical protein
MKVWVLAGLFTVATAPFAAAAENVAECQLDETRRTAAERVEPPPASPATVARATVAQRAPETTQRQPVERRRNGKRIPDAELIGPRGAL